MPAASLTFTSSAATTASGTFYALMDAINTLVGTDTSKWSIYTRVGSAGAYDALDIVAPTGSPCANFRICLAGRTSFSPATVNSPDTTSNLTLFGGIAPDGGTFAGSLWGNGSPPYGAVRWLGFNRITGAVTTFGEIVIIQSNETFFLGIKTTTPTWYWFYAGAIYSLPFDNARSESSGGTLYGMITSGSTVMSAQWAQANDQWLRYNASANTNHAWVFQPGTSTAWTVSAENRFLNTATSLSDLIGDGASSDRVYTGPHMFVRASGTPYRIGFLRDIYFGAGAWRTIVQQSASNKFICCAPSTSSADAMMFKAT